VASSPKPDSAGIRINRFLAQCGLGSRRACEELIATGAITVNNEICVNLATKVMPGDTVHYGSRLLTTKDETTILLNKPPGFLCTTSDPERRPTIYDLLPIKLRNRNLHHAGRLDLESQGLLVMTNSGDLSHRLTLPRNKVEKEYLVTIDRPFDFNLRRQFLEGIRIPEGLARAVSIEGDTSGRKLTLVLTQGLKRQIRSMFETVGYTVKTLERVRIGHLAAPNLAPGEHILLNSRDIEHLFVTGK
jgi:23S rRNA pseudouridine2605 synthase